MFTRGKKKETPKVYDALSEARLANITRDPDVFLSYKRGSTYTPIAEAVFDRLKEAGYKVWFDQVDVPAGDNFLEAIEDGIRNAHTVVVFLSPEYFASAVCQIELDLAMREGKRLLCFSVNGLPEDFAKHAEDNDADITRNAKTSFGRANVSSKRNYDTISQKGLNIKFLRRVDAVKVYEKRDLTPEEREPEYFDDASTQVLEELQKPDLQTAITLRDYMQEARKKNYLRGKRLRDAQTFAAKHVVPQELADFLAESARRQARATGIVTAVSLTLVLVFAFVALRAVFFEQVSLQEAFRANTEATKVAIQLNRTQRVQQSLATRNKIKRLALDVTPLKAPPTLFGMYAWFADAEGRLHQLRADSLEVVSDNLLPDVYVEAVTTDGRFLWASARAMLVRIDRDNQVTAFALPATPRVLSFDASWVWAWLENGDLLALDPQTLQTRQRYRVGSGIEAQQVLVSKDNLAWAIDATTNELVRLNAAKSETRRVRLNRNTYKPLLVNDDVWVLDNERGLLRRFNAQTFDEIQSWTFGGNPREPYVEGDTLWLVFSTGSQQVVQLNLQTGDELQRFDAGASPLGVFTHRQNVWVFTNQALRVFDKSTKQLKFELTQIAGSTATWFRESESLWVNEENGFSVVSLTDGTLRHRFDTCQEPSRLSFDGGNVWAICRAERALIRIPTYITFYETADIGEQLRPLAPIIVGNSAWLVLENRASMTEIDLVTGNIVREIQLNFNNTARKNALEIFVDQSTVWIANTDARQMARVDARDASITYAELPLESSVRFTKMNQQVWVTGWSTQTDNTFVFDANDGKLIASLKYGMVTTPPVLSTDGQSIWLASAVVAGKLYRLNALTLAIEAQAEVGALPILVLVEGKSVWVVTGLRSDCTDCLTEAFQALGRYNGEVLQFRASDLTLRNRFEAGELGKNAFVVEGHLWVFQSVIPVVGGNSERTVVVFDLATGQEVGAWALCDSPNPYLDPQTNRFWVSCVAADNSLYTPLAIFNANTRQLERVYDNLGKNGWSPRRYGDEIWVSYQETPNLAVLDANTGDVLRLIGVGNAASELGSDAFGYLWLANRDDGMVQRLQLNTP
jgi:streptogramin lyase